MLGMSCRHLVLLVPVALGGAAVLGVLTARHGVAEAYAERSPQLGKIKDLMPQYPNMTFYPMGQSLHVAGVDREMAYGTTVDAPFKVAERYEAIWESQSYDVDRHSADDEEWVSARAPNDPWVRSVVIARSHGRTTVIASVSAAEAEGDDPRIPVPSFCDAVSHTGARDQGVRTEMVFAACEGYVREVVDYYDAALHGTDRKERIDPASSKGGVFVTYSGSDVEVMLVAKQSDTDPPMTAVTVTWQER